MAGPFIPQPDRAFLDRTKTLVTQVRLPINGFQHSGEGLSAHLYPVDRLCKGFYHDA
jgi:hypothetical protein